MCQSRLIDNTRVQALCMADSVDKVFFTGLDWGNHDPHSQVTTLMLKEIAFSLKGIAFYEEVFPIHRHHGNTILPSSAEGSLGTLLGSSAASGARGTVPAACTGAPREIFGAAE